MDRCPESKAVLVGWLLLSMAWSVAPCFAFDNAREKAQSKKGASRFNWETLLWFPPAPFVDYAATKRPHSRPLEVLHPAIVISSGSSLHISPLETRKNLKKESSIELIETFLNHPFYWGMHLSNNLQRGFEFSADTTTFHKLLTHKDAGTELLAKYHNMESDFETRFKVETGDPDYFLDLHQNLCEMEMLLAQYSVINSLTKPQRRTLLKEALTKFQTAEHSKRSRMVFTELLLGRILQQEKYSPFMRKIKEDPDIAIFLINGPRVSSISIFKTILSQTWQFLSDKEKQSVYIATPNDQP